MESATAPEISNSLPLWTKCLGRDLAWALRNRAAGLLLTSPQDSAVIADALMRASEARAGDPFVAALAWRSNAEAEAYLGRLKESRRGYERADGEARSSGDLRLLGEILVGRIGVLHALADGAAVPLVDEAKSILSEAGHAGYLARLHMNLGSAAFHREDSATAYSEFQEARRIFAQLGQRDATSMSLLVNLGSACTELLLLDEAREVLTEVQVFADETGLPHLAAHARLDLSFVDRIEGRYRDALSQLERAERDFDAVGATDLKATTQLTRAEISLELGLAAEAFAHSSEAASAFEEQEKSLDRDHARIVQGRSLTKLRRFRPARRIFERLRDDAISRDWRERRLTTLLDLARLELAARKPGRALEHLEGNGFSSAVGEAGIDGLGIIVSAEAALAGAQAHLALSDPGRAEQALETLRSHPRRLPLRIQSRLYLLLGRIARVRGEFRQSRREFDRAVRVCEQIRSTIPGVELRAAAFQEDALVHRERVEVEIAAARTRRTKSGQPSQAASRRILDWTRKARSRSFWERRERRLLPEELERLRNEIGRLSRAREEREYDPASQAEFADLDSRIGRLESRFLREYRLWEASQAEEENSSVSDARGPDRSVRAESKNVVIIEYFLAIESVLAIVTSRDGVILEVLDTTVAEVERSVEALRFQLDAFVSLEGREIAHPESLRRAAEGSLHDLYGMILEPLLPRLGNAKRIRVVPHGVLHHVPYASLFDGKGYVMDRFEVEVSASGGPASLLRRRKSATLAANVRTGPALARTEVERIGSSLGERSRLLLDPTVADLLAALERGSIVHLATHGTFRDDNPLFTRLTLSDRSLFVSDLASTRLDTDLLILSSCDSGRTFAGQGDDLQGLAHAFLSSGIRRLVASLWRVDDSATQQLMERFHHHLFAPGETDPTSALHLAMREVREERPHPFLWGGFVVLSP